MSAPDTTTSTQTESIKTTTETESEKIHTWKDIGLCPELTDCVKLVSWKTPTPIQYKTIPIALTGKDIIGHAKTGSGKTGAFLLPILQKLLVDQSSYFALILTPTRELALQIIENITKLGKSINVRSLALIGGLSKTDQAIFMQRQPHILVGTPGRVLDHLENTEGFEKYLKNLKFLVFDEADKLLDFDFKVAIMSILSHIPKSRTTYLFSATMTTKVQDLQRASLIDPVMISTNIGAESTTVSELRQEYLFIPKDYKLLYLTSLLSEFSGKSIIVFVKRIDYVERVTRMLRNLGYDALSLHGKMAQPKRIMSLKKFKNPNDTSNILIATDVVSRGVDIPAVDVVINFDFPISRKDYIHRVGRTARAGRSGLAVNLITQYDLGLFTGVEKMLKIKMTEYPLRDGSLQNVLSLWMEKVETSLRLVKEELADESILHNKKYKKNRR